MVKDYSPSGNRKITLEMHWLIDTVCLMGVIAMHEIAFRDFWGPGNKKHSPRTPGI